jgi:hypothetical protein
MHLTGQEQRIHGDAEIIDNDVVLDIDIAGVRINFQLADVGAVRIGRLGLLDLFARLQRLTGPGSDFCEGHLLVGTDNADHAAVEFKIVNARLPACRPPVP